MIMPRRSSTDGCGNTMRTVEQATSQSGQVFVNQEVLLATDGMYDYSEAQPLYQGNSRCDPARDGSDQIDCCQ